MFTLAMQNNLTVEEKAHYNVPVTGDELQELADNQQSLDLLADAAVFNVAPLDKTQAESIVSDIEENARNEEKESFKMILEKITGDLNTIIEDNTTYKGVVVDIERLLKLVACWQDNLQ